MERAHYEALFVGLIFRKIAISKIYHSTCRKSIRIGLYVVSGPVFMPRL
jgi:hypothetical protein